MSKKIFFIVIAAVVLLITALFLFALIFAPRGGAYSSEYSAVYLVSGDVYFGKLSWSPRMKLTNVWYLQRTVDAQNQPQLSLAPFTGAFWGPKDEIYLNPENVLFWASLRTDSELARALANPSAFQPPQAPVPAPEPQAAPQ